MNSSGTQKDYSFNLERDQVTTRGELIMFYTFGVILAFYGLTNFLNAFKAGSFGHHFIMGVFISLSLIASFYFWYFRKDQKSKIYLTIDQGKLKYRWGRFHKEKQVDLDQLNYTSSSPYEVILRFLDRSEIIIDNNLLTNHPTKFDELKEVLLSYHQKKTNL